MEELWLFTVTLSPGAAGRSVTVTSRTELTAMETSASARANPAAETVMWYAPGSRSSIRNSPRSSLTASRSNDEPVDRTTIFADATRAPVASCTAPRSDPRGFCACSCANKIIIIVTSAKISCLNECFTHTSTRVVKMQNVSVTGRCGLLPVLVGLRIRKSAQMAQS